MTLHTPSIHIIIASSLVALALTACDQKKADAPATPDAPEAATDKSHDKAASKTEPESNPAGAKHDGHAGMDHSMHHGEAPDPSGIPKDQSGSGKTKQGKFHVTFAPTKNPIPFQQLFGLEVRVFAPDEKTPSKGAKLDQVRAIMPAHKHGMNVEPEVEETGDGVFAVSGMRFHMQGEGDDGKWVLEFVINDGTSIDTFSHELQCCR